jgi:hypothetical protein
LLLLEEEVGETEPCHEEQMELLEQQHHQGSAGRTTATAGSSGRYWAGTNMMRRTAGTPGQGGKEAGSLYSAEQVDNSREEMVAKSAGHAQTKLYSRSSAASAHPPHLADATTHRAPLNRSKKVAKMKRNLGL